MAINKAQQLVKETGNLPIPLALRNAPTKLMRDLGYGKGYKYPHDHPGNFANMEFLPDDIIGTSFFNPGSSKKEQEVSELVNKLWKGKYK
jgi:putative ATPase